MHKASWRIGWPKHARCARASAQRNHTAPLLLTALASSALYGWLALRYPLLAGLEQGRASWITLADRSLAAGLLHAAVYGLLLALYLLALRCALSPRPAARGPGIIWGGWLVMAATLLVGGFWFMPWYVLWALPLAVLLPASASMRVWLPALTLGALWNGLAADGLGLVRPPLLTPTEVSWVSVGLLMAPLAGVALLQSVRRGLRARPQRW